LKYLNHPVIMRDKTRPLFFSRVLKSMIFFQEWVGQEFNKKKWFLFSNPPSR
jgi:hypothetical protein